MSPPLVSIYQHQSVHAVDLAWLESVITRAVPFCQAEAKCANSPLLQLSEVEASIVSDEEIARIHADFLDDPTPTDVITFHHGEIVVSADTAAREGPAHGLPFAHELALYLIHGLMHLGGWDDHEEAEAAEMKLRQERVMRASL
jgi:probable rRNA maturation factor